jgi:hypothetical protein
VNAREGLFREHRFVERDVRAERADDLGELGQRPGPTFGAVLGANRLC